MSAAAEAAIAGAGVGAHAAAAPPTEEQVAGALQVVRQLVQTHLRLDVLYQIRVMLENEEKRRLAQQVRAIQAAADKGRPKKGQRGLRLEVVVTSELYQAAVAAREQEEAADALKQAAKKRGRGKGRASKAAAAVAGSTEEEEECPDKAGTGDRGRGGGRKHGRSSRGRGRHAPAGDDDSS